MPAAAVGCAAVKGKLQRYRIIDTLADKSKMPEVRQEVIVLTAVVVTALVTFIGIQALYPVTKSKSFTVKKATVAQSSSEQKEPSQVKKPATKADNTCGDEKLCGKIIEGASIDQIYLHEIKSLRTSFQSAGVPNVPMGSAKNSNYNKIMGDEDFILNEIKRKHTGRGSSDAFLRAGPRAVLHFDPTKVRAAVVTCGGLCPGLNSVIRELVHSLYYNYGAEAVIGIRGGFSGFLGKADMEPIDLTLEAVLDIHHQGGSILGTARGGFDIDVIISFLEENNINQLYVIGGDGTHRAAEIIAETCFARHKNIAVVGIPKTIDNDVDLIDRSFGFTTSVEEAQDAIVSAKTEARCAIPNGIGIVKLMGRSAGFIAVHATLASGDVDLCLIPEVKIELEGETGCLPFLFDRVKEQGHAVVVVAEGAGEDLLGKSTQVDKGGNRKLPPIGEYLKDQIAAYFVKRGEEATIKYLDPSYMIRSVPANSSDSVYCMVLAQNAVHGAMAGYTSFSVGLVNNRVVLIPITRLVATSPRVMDPFGRTWERVLSITRQPNTEPSFDANACTVQSRTM